MSIQDEHGNEIVVDDAGWFLGCRVDKTGELVDAKGVRHLSRDAYIEMLLGFCGCGAPEAAREYVRERMRLVYDFHDQQETQSALALLRNGEAALFQSPGERYFFWYWLDEKGYSEHGGSVPGWLTREGKVMLAALEWLKAQEAAA